MARIPRTAEMLKDIPSGTAQQVFEYLSSTSSLILNRFTQLFNAVHYHTDSPGSTMLPSLDKHIIESRAGTWSSLARGDVIEVQGPAASGKTQLLYHLAASCVLPKEVLVTSIDAHAERAVHIGGWCRSTIVLDCDGRWDTRRLHDILVTRLDTSFSKTQLPPFPHKPNLTVSSIALESLSRLHIFRPTSSFQLAATLINLPKYHAEQMPNEEIRLLFVDSISSFYWADKWQAEHLGPQPYKYNALEHVLRCLQVFRGSHGPVIVLTNWGLNPLPSTTSSTSSTPFFKQHIPSPFPSPFDDPRRRSLGHPSQLPLNYHLTLPFSFVSQLEPDPRRPDGIGGHGGVELEVALRDTRKKEVVRRGEIGGYVRIPHTSCGEDRTAIGRFRFQVLERDVVALAST